MKKKTIYRMLSIGIGLVLTIFTLVSTIVSLGGGDSSLHVLGYTCIVFTISSFAVLITFLMTENN